MAAIAARRSSRSPCAWWARSPGTPSASGVPISGIGGIETWRDAAEFIALGAGSVQVCTAAMHYGFKIVEDMTSGLANWMDEKGYRTPRRLPGLAVRNYVELGRARHQLQDHRQHQPGPVHQVRPLPHRLRGHLAPGDRRACATTASGATRSSTRSASAATCACMSARSRAASPWSRSSNGLPYMTWGEDPRNPQNMRQAAE